MIKLKEGKKKVLKWIKEEVKKLEPEYYTAYSKYFTPILMEEDGKKFLKIAEPELFLVSHKRRAFRAYKSQGLIGLTNYFQKHGFELKTINNE